MSSIGHNLCGRAEGDAMRKWFLPMTVLGLGGVGMLLFTERGRRGLRWAAEHLPEAPRHFAEWNETAQRELDRIQTALNKVAETLESSGDLAIS